MQEAYYSREALELGKWARQEPNRIKASRIFKAALSLEKRYRDNHVSEISDPYTKATIGIIDKPPLLPYDAIKKANEIARKMGLRDKDYLSD